MPDEDSVLKIVCPSCGQKLDVTRLEPFTKLDCPACAGEVIVPRPFGDLLLEEPIGSGGTASVYRALDLTLDREVAVKMLDEQIASRPGRVKMFLKEARSAASVNHPNVVPIYSCGEAEGRPYLVMQYMAGLSLDRTLQSAPRGLELGEAIRVAGETARGLEAAHRHGIIHHDVKPGNILVDADSNVRIGDFGLAEALRGDTVAADDAEAPWITPYYVSCERVLTGKEDYRGDIYSLGATVYHLLTGRPPFEGNGSGEIAWARTKGVLPAAPSEVRPEIPGALSDYVLRLLAPNPAERPQAYAEIVSALETFQKALKQQVALRNRLSAAPRAAGPRDVRTLRPGPRSYFWLNVGILTSLLVVLLLVPSILRRNPSWRRTVGRIPVVSKLVGVAGTVAQGESRRGAQGADGRAQPVAHLSAGTGEAKGSARGSYVPLGDSMRRVRPKPANLDFSLATAAVKSYLNDLPTEVRTSEAARIELVGSCKEYLQELMKRFTYEDEAGAGIRMRDGSVLRGSVAYCTEAFFGIRLPDVGLKKVEWSDIALEQYVAFLDYYMRMRLERGAQMHVGKSASSYRREAGDDCVRLAALCDWYEMPAKARHYEDLARTYGSAAGLRRLARP
ncbi:MAG: serine/threonine protein kinase [Lentisphaerae bacterium]|jgi:serine/threonine protein kinase|nr:serine/threonine protein kinase [Lentisphaerota bacterium]MBT4820763.1 serine/threonine protein kinase [Lentisphaerota bacterium]MBT5611776.1 serine/threonine protein kinase [Lentisphaerota bacterium]MBT7057319.1 serine/threonine protein kinase [Lentisphaerota bacterium]MBT7841837.1 serine/threonine protein kinase [Lentisphaerota bacterium]